MTEQPSRLLIVDDDLEIRNLLAQLLKNSNYQVYTAENGEEMFSILQTQIIDLIILDVMMPGESGLSLCAKLRKSSSIPIIMLTAVGDDMDKIVGLEMGADDYLAKPFNSRELIARIKAVLRRSRDAKQNTLTEIENEKNVVSFAGWIFDLSARLLLSPEMVEISISAGEYDLLKAFVEHPLQVLSRDQLMNYIHKRQFEPFDRSIDVQVSRLRQKIEQDPKNPALIKTVRGGGYMFSARVKIQKLHDTA
ncbi:MAG: response regulator [Pseudomonadota bacterium]